MDERAQQVQDTLYDWHDAGADYFVQNGVLVAAFPDGTEHVIRIPGLNRERVNYEPAPVSD